MACSSLNSDYTASDSGRDAATDCYLTTTSTKYVASANSNQTTCAKGGYCAGGTKVYYGSTGGRTTCPANSYCVAGVSSATACNTLASGFYPNSEAGSDEAADCKTNSISGKYVASANATSATNCGGNTKYKGSHQVNYGSTSSCSTVSTGYYTTGGDANTRTGQSPCTAGNYCTDGSSYSCSTQTSSKYTSSAAQSSSINDCYLTLSAGYRVASAGAGASACGGGTYSTSTSNIYYGGSVSGRSTTSSCSNITAGYFSSGGGKSATPGSSDCLSGYSCGGCSGRTKYSGAGSSSCSDVSSGYYTTGCNSSNNLCTGQTQCEAGYYCSSGVRYGCPDASTYKRTTFPDNYYSPSIDTTSVSSGAGLTAITQCQVLNWMTGTRGSLYEYVYYNSSTNKYDGTTTSYGWHSPKAGYYLTNKSGCGWYAYYSTAEVCPAGSYCPGKSSVVCNSSNSSTVWTTNFGLESCPSGYPNSAAGAGAITSCYSGTKSRAWSGSQTSCSKPSNCATVSCSSCSNAACDYVAYSNSSGTGDGTIKSGCSTNNASCQQGISSVTANAGYYVSGTTCPKCSDKNSTYPNSAAGNTGGWTACYSNDLSRAWTGSGQDGTAPTNSYSATWNSCSGSACTYTAYLNSAGTGDGTVKSGCSTNNATCTRTLASYTCKSGYHTASGNTCASCSTTTSTNYPNSDNGNTGGVTACYSNTKSRAWTGSQTACSNPDTTGCSAYTCNSCSNNACDYVAYANSAGTGDGTVKSGCSTNNAACQQTVATLTAKSNYYVNGTSSCPTCTSASSSYPYSDGGSIGSGKCYTNTTRGCTKNNASTPNNCSVTSYNDCSCDGGTYKSYKDGTTSGTTSNESCTKTVKTVSANAGYYVSGTSCTACSGLASGFYPNSTGGNTGGASACYTDNLTGKYIASANATSATDCPAGTYKGEHAVNYGDTSSCVVCGNNKYSTAGSVSCTACTTANGYGNSGDTASAHAGLSSCKVTCPGGSYVATAGAGCVDVGAGNWSAGGIVGEDATLSRSECPTVNGKKWTTIGYGAGADEAGDCGRVLHVGNAAMYMRSIKKTWPSLNIQDGEYTFFGNASTTPTVMNTDTDKHLKIYDGETLYYVHDDSVE